VQMLLKHTTVQDVKEYITEKEGDCCMRQDHLFLQKTTPCACKQESLLQQSKDPMAH
jgi:hypothetical protein